MKKSLLKKVLPVLAVMLLYNCSKNDTPPESDCYITDVCLTGEPDCNPKKISFDVAKKGLYEIAVSNSLCPSSYWLKVLLYADNKPVLDTVFTNFTQYKNIFEFAAGSHIEAQATAITGQSDIQCTTVGKATLSVCKSPE